MVVKMKNVCKTVWKAETHIWMQLVLDLKSVQNRLHQILYRSTRLALLSKPAQTDLESQDSFARYKINNALKNRASAGRSAGQIDPTARCSSAKRKIKILNFIFGFSKTLNFNKICASDSSPGPASSGYACLQDTPSVDGVAMINSSTIHKGIS